MFTCTKCGKKAKTSYERTFGDKPTFEPVGFYCHTCGIFYDAKSKRASKVVYGVAKRKNDVGGQTAEHEIQMPHEPYTIAAQNAYGLEPERTRKELLTGKIEHEKTLDHLCVRQVSQPCDCN